MVMSSGWGLRTSTRISPGWNSTRRTSSSSAGGGLEPPTPVSEPPDETNAAAAATSSTIGSSASSRGERTPPRRTGGESVVTSVVHDVEEPHPTELGELRLVGVEHEAAGAVPVDLDDPPLAL